MDLVINLVSLWREEDGGGGWLWAQDWVAVWGQCVGLEGLDLTLEQWDDVEVV